MNTRFDTSESSDNDVTSNEHAWYALLRASKNWNTICLQNRASLDLPRVSSEILADEEITNEQLKARNKDGMGACIGAMFVKGAGVSANRLRHPESEKNKPYVKKVEQFGEKTLHALREQRRYCQSQAKAQECVQLHEVQSEIEKFLSRIQKK